MRRPSHPFLLAFAVASLTAGCASTGAVPQPFPRPGADPSWAPPRAVGIVPGDGYTIAGTALSLRGAPYKDGGADPGGFDCSGFISYVFGQHGIAVPRTVTLQFAAGESVQSAELRAGDLVFFSTTAPGPSHVGMLIGGDEFVHAPSTRGEVRVERLQSTYWGPRFVGARRLVR